MTAKPSNTESRDACWTCLMTLLTLCVVSSVGCQRDVEIDTQYGLRRGVGAQSVNGTSVLSGMFEKAGYHVGSWRRLSPKLDKEQVIVWAPDRFGTPTADEITYFERWLNDEADRTLIFIGRDYDAAPEYWRKVMPPSPSAQRLRVRQQSARARSAHAASRWSRFGATVRSSECEWFVFDSNASVVRIDAVRGPLTGRDEPLAVDLASRTSIDLHQAHQDTEDSERSYGLEATSLLTGNDRVLAARLHRTYWGDSQIIVVADGSWLLNLPQVDHANRRLAAELIGVCGPPGRVCFLESGEHELQFTETDSEPPLMMRLFTIWPINVFVTQLVLVGVVYCFYAWPIFGPAKRLRDDTVSDFGKHITAVGEMLERGRDHEYAQRQIDQFHESERKYDESNDER